VKQETKVYNLADDEGSICLAPYLFLLLGFDEHPLFAALLVVAAQVEFESKIRKRYTTS
jgi:hypothetical protein